MAELTTDDQDSVPPGRQSARPLGAYVVDSPDGSRLDQFFAAGTGGLEIGREPGSRPSLALDDRRLSRSHAVLRSVSGRLVLEDAGSRNGTFVNGARIASSDVRVGDLARLGDTLLEICELDPCAPPPITTGPLLTRAPELLYLVARLDRAARASDLPVLLTGETGTGKELFAQRLHERSGRRGAFVAVNCAAIPANLVEAQLFGHKKGAFTGAVSDAAGLFLRADQGTLFLDEVGELPVEVQPKLLRALETREVVRVGSESAERCELRVVAATNADLEERIDKGGFRNDLYARLSGLVLQLPPLRKRRRDVPLLARELLARAAPGRPLVLRAAFLERLALYDWPRNVRELKMAMERVALLDEDVLDASAVEALLSGPRLSGRAAARTGAPSREELIGLLEEHRGNVAQTAAALGRDTRQVYRWLERYGIEVSGYRSQG